MDRDRRAVGSRRSGRHDGPSRQRRRVRQRRSFGPHHWRAHYQRWPSVAGYETHPAGTLPVFLDPGPDQCSARGLVRYSDGSVRAVYGVPGNLVVASSTLLTADAVSFSDSGGLISQNGKISLVKLDGTPLATYDWRRSIHSDVTGDLRLRWPGFRIGTYSSHWSGSALRCRGQ